MKLQKIKKVKFCVFKNGFDICDFGNRYARIRRHTSEKVVYVVFFDNSGLGILSGKFDVKFPQIVEKFKKLFLDREKS